MTHSVSEPIEPQISAEDVQRKPWRYIGYRGLSEFLASDDDHLVIRRFDALAARVILSLQWEVSKLESELSKLDYTRSHLVVKDLNNGSLELDDDERQKTILAAKTRLEEYYRFVNEYSRLRVKPDATRYHTENVRNWLNNHAGVIDQDEAAAFTDNHDDLFPINTTVRTPLRHALEKLTFFRSSRFFRRQQPNKPLTRPDTIPTEIDAATVIYQADKRIDTFVNAVICVVGFLLLAIPLWILFYVTSKKYQLMVITLFIAFFLTVIQSVSVARPFESLAATAAYSAVLMVFMQIGSSPGPEGS